MWAQLLVTFVGKCAINVSYNVIYVYVSELYHTEIRVGAVTCGNIVSNIAVLCAPYIVLIAFKVLINLEKLMFMQDEFQNKTLLYVPMVIFGVTGLVAGILMFFMPETQGKPLPETLEETLQISNGRKLNPFASRKTNLSVNKARE